MVTSWSQQGHHNVPSIVNSWLLADWGVVLSFEILSASHHQTCEVWRFSRAPEKFDSSFRLQGQRLTYVWGCLIKPHQRSRPGSRAETSRIREGQLTCFPARGREGDELFPWDLISLSPSCRKTGIVVPLLFCSSRPLSPVSSAEPHPGNSRQKIFANWENPSSKPCTLIPFGLRARLC